MSLPLESSVLVLLFLSFTMSYFVEPALLTIYRLEFSSDWQITLLPMHWLFLVK